jgi:hypothetical protein
MNRWLEGLSNWQFVAVVAGLLAAGLFVEACVFLLVTGHLNLTVFITESVVFTVVTTGLQAWKRWR